MSDSYCYADPFTLSEDSVMVLLTNEDGARFVRSNMRSEHGLSLLCSAGQECRDLGLPHEEFNPYTQSLEFVAPRPMKWTLTQLLTGDGDGYWTFKGTEDDGYALWLAEVARKSVYDDIK